MEALRAGPRPTRSPSTSFIPCESLRDTALTGSLRQGRLQSVSDCRAPGHSKQKPPSGSKALLCLSGLRPELRAGYARAQQFFIGSSATRTTARGGVWLLVMWILIVAVCGLQSVSCGSSLSINYVIARAVFTKTARFPMAQHSGYSTSYMGESSLSV